MSICVQRSASKILEGPKVSNPYEGKTVGSVIFENGRKFSERIWQVDLDSDKYETYDSMKERAVRLALQMQTWGITSSDVVSCCSANSMDVGIAAISTFFIGATISHIDPTLAQREVQTLLNIVHPALIFVEESVLKTIEDSLRSLDFTYKIVVLGLTNRYDCFLETQNPHPNERTFEPVNIGVNEPCVILFSKGAGSTGVKATVHSQASFFNMIHRFLTCGIDISALLYFSSSYWMPTMCLFAATLVSGGCRFIARHGKFNDIFPQIEFYGIKTIYVAPVMTFKITNCDAATKHVTTSVTSILTGGAAISSSQIVRLKNIFTKAQILISYELTEMGPICIYASEPEKTTRRGLCGKLAANVLGKVVDLDSKRSLEPRERGELRFKSASLMLGYYKQSSDEFFDEDGFFQTGDIGYYDEDNNFYLIGRSKEVFKYMSWPVVPAIIERALCEHHAVYEAVVFGIPANEVEVGELPTAWIVLKPGAEATVNEIARFVADRITDNEKLRGGIYFKRALPKSANGRVLRSEIRMKYIHEPRMSSARRS